MNPMTLFWEKFHILSKDKTISSRIRFTCMDVIEMKNNRWVARGGRKEMRAMTLDEIKAEQEREIREEERKVKDLHSKARGGGRDIYRGGGDRDRRGGDRDRRGGGRDDRRGGGRDDRRGGGGDFRKGGGFRSGGRDSGRDAPRRDGRDGRDDRDRRGGGGMADRRPGGGGGGANRSRFGGRDTSRDGPRRNERTRFDDRRSGGRDIDGGRRSDDREGAKGRFVQTSQSSLSMLSVKSKKGTKTIGGGSERRGSSSKTEPAPVKMDPAVVKTKVKATLAEYINLMDGVTDSAVIAKVTTETVECFTELKLAEYSIVPEMCLEDIILMSSPKDAAKRASVSILMKELFKNKLLDEKAVNVGTTRILEYLIDIKIDAPKAIEYFADYMANLHVEGMLDISNFNAMVVTASANNEYSGLIEFSGAADVMRLLLPKIAALSSEEVACKAASSVDAKAFLHPEKYPDLKKWVEDSSLTLYYPALAYGAAINERLSKRESANDILEWIQKEITNNAVLQDAKFVRAVMFAVLRHIIEPAETPDLKEAEIANYQPFLKYVMNFGSESDNIDIQVHCLFAVLEFCNDSGFENNLIALLFKQLYQHGVVSESAIAKYRKHDIDVCPGFKKGLTKLSSFFSFLDTAEEEDSDEEDE